MCRSVGLVVAGDVLMLVWGPQVSQSLHGFCCFVFCGLFGRVLSMLVRADVVGFGYCHFSRSQGSIFEAALTSQLKRKVRSTTTISAAAWPAIGSLAKYHTTSENSERDNKEKKTNAGNDRRPKDELEEMPRWRTLHERERCREQNVKQYCNRSAP